MHTDAHGFLADKGRRGRKAFTLSASNGGMPFSQSGEGYFPGTGGSCFTHARSKPEWFSLVMIARGRRASAWLRGAFVLGGGGLSKNSRGRCAAARATNQRFNGGSFAL